jgi:hypothetical protein
VGRPALCRRVLVTRPRPRRRRRTGRHVRRHPWVECVWPTATDSWSG